MKIWVDPDEGWRWGFPKVYDDLKDGPLEDWLIAQGYPAKEEGSAGVVRMWPWDARDEHTS